jgi:hypothetical protein
MFPKLLRRMRLSSGKLLAAIAAAMIPLVEEGIERLEHERLVVSSIVIVRAPPLGR